MNMHPDDAMGFEWQKITVLNSINENLSKDIKEDKSSKFEKIKSQCKELGLEEKTEKFADCAFALDKQLKRVDFPTFGKPTIPHCNAIDSSF